MCIRDSPKIIVIYLRCSKRRALRFLTAQKGPYWNRQERLLYSKHVGARLFTPLTNNDQTILIGNRQLAMAA